MAWTRWLMAIPPERAAAARSHPARYLVGETVRLGGAMALAMLFIEWTGLFALPLYTPRHRLFFVVGWGALMATLQLLLIRFGESEDSVPRGT